MRIFLKVLFGEAHNINNGNPVKRKGTYNFTVAGQRRYWRMQEMTNPDDPCCDYVDIYFD